MPAKAAPALPPTPFESALLAAFERLHGNPDKNSLLIYLEHRDPDCRSSHYTCRNAWARALAVPAAVSPYAAIDYLEERGRPVILGFDLTSKKTLRDQFESWAAGDILHPTSFHKRPALFLAPRERFGTRYETAAREQAQQRATRPALRLVAVNGAAP